MKIGEILKKMLETGIDKTDSSASPATFELFCSQDLVQQLRDISNLKFLEKSQQIFRDYYKFLTCKQQKQASSYMEAAVSMLHSELFPKHLYPRMIWDCFQMMTKNPSVVFPKDTILKLIAKTEELQVFYLSLVKAQKEELEKVPKSGEKCSFVNFQLG